MNTKIDKDSNVNIGVISLNSSNLPNPIMNNRFDIEDNIGECIHIHYKNIRFDFTIKDFLILSEGCKLALNKLEGLDVKLLHFESNIKNKPIHLNIIQEIESTHIDKPKRIYYICSNKNDGEVIDNNTQLYFVIPKHFPWIDPEILDNPTLKMKIIKYSQMESNHIVPIYDITEEHIITKFYPDMFPLLIKSANNFYDKNTFNILSKNHKAFFDDYNNAIDFYNRVKNSYIEFYRETGCYFEDIGANNILIKDNYSDFKILDIASLRVIKDENKKILIPSYEEIACMNGSNDIGFGR